MYKAMRDIPALNGVTYKQGDPVPVNAAPDRIMRSLASRGVIKAEANSAMIPPVEPTNVGIAVEVPNLEDGAVKVIITGEKAQRILNQLALQGFLTVQDGELSFGSGGMDFVEGSVDQIRIPIMVKMPDDQQQEFLLAVEQMQLVFTLLQTHVKEMEDILGTIEDLAVLAVADAVDIRKSAKPLYENQAKKLLDRPPDTGSDTIPNAGENTPHPEGEGGGA